MFRPCGAKPTNASVSGESGRRGCNGHVWSRGGGVSWRGNEGEYASRDCRLVSILRLELL